MVKQTDQFMYAGAGSPLPQGHADQEANFVSSDDSIKYEEYVRQRVDASLELVWKNKLNVGRSTHLICTMLNCGKVFSSRFCLKRHYMATH